MAIIVKLLRSDYVRPFICKKHPNWSFIVSPLNQVGLNTKLLFNCFAIIRYLDKVTTPTGLNNNSHRCKPWLVLKWLCAGICITTPTGLNNVCNKLLRDRRWANRIVVGIFIKYPPVVGDAEPLPWQTPNNGGGIGGGGEIQGWYLFERVQLLLVTLNPCLGKHQTTAAGNCITTLTGLNNNSQRCKPMVMRRNLYYNPNGVEQRMPQDAPRPTPNQYNVVVIFIRHTPSCWWRWTSALANTKQRRRENVPRNNSDKHINSQLLQF